MSYPSHLSGLIDLMVEAVVRDLEMENAALPAKENAALKDSIDDDDEDTPAS